MIRKVIREVVRAIAFGDKVKSRVGYRIECSLNGRSSNHSDWSWRETISRISIVRGVFAKIFARYISVKLRTNSINDGRVSL